MANLEDDEEEAKQEWPVDQLLIQSRVLNEHLPQEGFQVLK